MTLYQRDDFKAALEAGALREALAPGAAATTFEALFGLRGEVHRQAANRRTLRIDTDNGKSYFAKLHDGVGWREIAKSLLSAKAPVLGARNEYTACRTLAAAGVTAPTVAAFGERGRNPARRKSFVVCDALEGYASLEDFVCRWTVRPPPVALKRRLVVAVARLVRAMHEAGVQHRDCYLAHFHAEVRKLAAGEVELAVIDLHRARQRRPLPARWRRRDLAALLYSAARLPLTRMDQRRFVAAYSRRPSQSPAVRTAHFWRQVERRAQRLERRARAAGVAAALPPTGDDGSPPAATVASIGRFADLGREPALPFRVDVDFGNGGQRVVCSATLRSQPGRRFVAAATIDGRRAVLKAFFGPRAQRDFAREQRGVAALQATGVPTPKLLASGKGGGALVLAFEHVEGRRPTADDSAALLALLAQLHDRGLRQYDLHLGNFLVCEGQPLAIDGGGVRAGRLTKRRRTADAGRLLAEFGIDEAPNAQAAALDYQGAETSTVIDAERLAVATARARRRRVAREMAKCLRDCTPYVVQRERGRKVVVARGDDDPALWAVIADPEQAIAGGEVLKRGNTACVVRVGDLVVKRYRAKGFWHRLRQRSGGGRARRAWQVGHGLRLVGLSTPRPRALIECPKARTGEAAAYLVLDHEPGPTLDEYTSAPEQAVAAMRTLLEHWSGMWFSHGDTKASNFIFRDGALRVVDLDAAVFHRVRWRFARRHRRDKARWRRNWEAH